MCLSPLLCNLTVCLLGPADLSDPCVYKLAGYRYLGQTHHPDFSFLCILVLKCFPIATRAFVGQIGSLSLGPSPKSVKALTEEILWILGLFVSVLFFFVSSF